MIDPHRKAIYICHADGTVEPLEIEALVEKFAADPEIQASGLEPWVIQEVIESVLRYLREELNREQVSLKELRDLARMLQQHFYKQVVKTSPQRYDLDLFQTALKCGSAFELEFFPAIRSFIAATVPPRVKITPTSPLTPATVEDSEHSLYITGLKQCSKLLAGRRRWSKRCHQVRDEIVHFIREESIRIGAKRLTLAVLS